VLLGSLCLEKRGGGEFSLRKKRSPGIQKLVVFCAGSTPAPKHNEKREKGYKQKRGLAVFDIGTARYEFEWVKERTAESQVEGEGCSYT